MKPLLLVFAAILMMSAPATAGPNPDWIILKDGAPVTLRPDRAYILYRTVRLPHVPGGMEVVFLREPVESEVAGYQAARQTAYVAAQTKRERERARAIEDRKTRPGTSIPPAFSEGEFTFRYQAPPNLMRVNNGHRYQKSDVESVYLVEAKPASYVIAGTSDKMLLNVVTCMCMGTVRFEAKPGVITDLGTILIDDVAKVSTIPEFAPPVTGRGARVNGILVLMVQTVRPYAEGATIPAALTNLPHKPADFRAVGKFPNRFATAVNRMAPIPGILAYDEDRVIDVKGDRTP